MVNQDVMKMIHIYYKSHLTKSRKLIVMLAHDEEVRMFVSSSSCLIFSYFSSIHVDLLEAE